MTFFCEVAVSVDIGLDDLENANSLWRRQVEARCMLGYVDLDSDILIKLGGEELRLDIATVLNIEHADDTVITVLHSCIGRDELEDFGISILIPSTFSASPECYVVIVQGSGVGHETNDLTSYVYVTEEDSAASILKVLCAVTGQSLV